MCSSPLQGHHCQSFIYFVCNIITALFLFNYLPIWTVQKKLHQENYLRPVHHFFIVPCVTQLHDAQILYLKLFLFSVCRKVNSNHGSTVCEKTRIFELHNSQKLSIECEEVNKTRISESRASRKYFLFFSDQSCGIQNKSFILQLSMPEVLSNNIEFCLPIIHYYLCHVLEVCKCPVHHTENRILRR